MRTEVPTPHESFVPSALHRLVAQRHTFTGLLRGTSLLLCFDQLVQGTTVLPGNRGLRRYALSWIRLFRYSSYHVPGTDTASKLRILRLAVISVPVRTSAPPRRQPSPILKVPVKAPQFSTRNPARSVFKAFSTALRHASAPRSPFSIRWARNYHAHGQSSTELGMKGLVPSLHVL